MAEFAKLEIVGLEFDGLEIDGLDNRKVLIRRLDRWGSGPLAPSGPVLQTTQTEYSPTERNPLNEKCTATGTASITVRSYTPFTVGFCFLITGPPNGPVLFCTLSSVGVVYSRL